MRIEWLPETARNLTSQLEWIVERDPWAAIDVVGTPYVVVYRIERTVVLVMRFLHGAQRWPPA